MHKVVGIKKYIFMRGIHWHSLNSNLKAAFAGPVLIRHVHVLMSSYITIEHLSKFSSITLFENESITDINYPDLLAPGLG